MYKPKHGRSRSIHLLDYRTTPHSTTGFAPSSTAKLSQTLSVAEYTSQSNIGIMTGQKSRWRHMLMWKHDPRFPISRLVIQCLVDSKSTSSTHFDPVPLQVVCTNGTMVTPCWNGKYIMRNASHFKVVDPILQGGEEKKMMIWYEILILMKSSSKQSEAFQHVIERESVILNRTFINSNSLFCFAFFCWYFFSQSEGKI